MIAIQPAQLIIERWGSFYNWISEYNNRCNPAERRKARPFEVWPRSDLASQLMWSQSNRTIKRARSHLILYISDRLRFCVQRKEINKHLKEGALAPLRWSFLEFEYTNKKRSSNRSDIQQPANNADAKELLFFPRTDSFSLAGRAGSLFST